MKNDPQFEVISGATVDAYAELDAHTIDAKIQEMLEGDPSQYTPDQMINMKSLIAALARRHYEDRWEHAVGHTLTSPLNYNPLLEYGRSPKPWPESIVRPEFYPEVLEIIYKIADPRSASGRGAGFLDLLVELNLHSIAEQGDLSRFPFKHPSMNAAWVADLVAGEHLAHGGAEGAGMALLKALAEARTPREFLAKIVAEKIPLGGEKGDYSLKALLPKLTAATSPEAAKDYLESIEAGLGSALSAAGQEAEVEAGLYCDIDGTLVRVTNPMDWDCAKGCLVPLGERDVLDDEVKAAIEQAVELKLPVILFSGDDPVKQTARLRALDVPESWLPVRDKRDFKGRTLQFVLDDTPPRGQGIEALLYVHPFKADHFAENMGKLLADNPAEATRPAGGQKVMLSPKPV